MENYRLPKKAVSKEFWDGLFPFIFIEYCDKNRNKFIVILNWNLKVKIKLKKTIQKFLKMVYN